jgi:mannose-6-phosphate isomerase-like protein (cupin superfamily)
MTRRPPRVVHLDEIEAIPGPGTLTWHPVRAELGLRAFGTNAYTAQNVGDDVVEPHDENPDLAHEELYFVARGRAGFTLDGERFDAPAGTYVFVPDPATHRHAVAQEPGTTVLSFGGPATFTPSAWEWMFRAVALVDRDVAEARAVVEDGLEKHPESPGLRIALARVLLAEGDENAARATIREAVAGRPDAEEYARQDATLSALL